MGTVPKLPINSVWVSFSFPSIPGVGWYEEGARGGGGATSPRLTPDVWTYIVRKWVSFEPQVARVAYSYMGTF